MLPGRAKPWMQAHPRRYDEMRFVIGVVLGLFVLFAACIVVPPPAMPT